MLILHPNSQNTVLYGILAHLGALSQEKVFGDVPYVGNPQATK